MKYWRRKLGTLWAALALIASVCVPQGYMPQWQDDILVIGICSGSSEKSVAIDENNPVFEALAELYGNDDSHHPDTKDMPNCAFSGAAQDMDGAPEFSFVFIIIEHLQALNHRYGAGLFQLFAQLPPATGPPVGI